MFIRILHVHPEVHKPTLLRRTEGSSTAEFTSWKLTLPGCCTPTQDILRLHPAIRASLHGLTTSLKLPLHVLSKLFEPTQQHAQHYNPGTLLLVSDFPLGYGGIATQTRD